MKRPLTVGSGIDSRRMAGWTSVFAGYRHAVNEARIDRWLAQFRKQEQDLAARILDSVDFVTQEQIAAAYRSLLAALPGWNPHETLRRGKWRFVAFSISAGQSGDTMLHRFRLANDLGSREYGALFIHKSELLTEGLGADDVVVFVDDFAGTGNQICDAWKENIQELLPGNPKAYLLLVSATSWAKAKVESETPLIVNPYISLGPEDNVFSDDCAHFSSQEKVILLRYCKKANRVWPKGFGQCGLLVVLAHNCPNDSIPILHAHNRRWEGLFRRHD